MWAVHLPDRQSVRNCGGRRRSSLSLRLELPMTSKTQIRLLFIAAVLAFALTFVNSLRA